jgi:hypothetical protein
LLVFLIIIIIIIIIRDSDPLILMRLLFTFIPINTNRIVKIISIIFITNRWGIRLVTVIPWYENTKFTISCSWSSSTDPLSQKFSK